MSSTSVRSLSSSSTSTTAAATRTSLGGVPSVPVLTSTRTTSSNTPSSSVSVRQSPSPSPNPSPSPPSNAALIGLIAGGATFAILLAVATVLIIRRRNNGRRANGGRGSAYGAQMFRQRSRKVVAMPEEAYRWNATNASTSDLHRGGAMNLAPSSTAGHSSSGVSLGYVNGPGTVTPYEDDSYMSTTPNGRNGNISYFTSLGRGKSGSNANEVSGITAPTGVHHFSVTAQDPAAFVMDSLRAGRLGATGTSYVDSPRLGATGLAKSYGASQFDYPSPLLSQRAVGAANYSDSPNTGRSSRPTTPTKTFGANHFDISSPNVQAAYPTYTGSPSISRPEVTAASGTDQINGPPKNSNPLSSFPSYGVSTMQRQGSRPTTPTKTFGANQFDTTTPYLSQDPTAASRQSNSHPTPTTKTFGANQFDSPSPFLAQTPLPAALSRPFQETGMKFNTDSPVLLQMAPPGNSKRNLAGASQFDAPSPFLSQRPGPEYSPSGWSRPIADSPSLSSRYPPGGVAPSGYVNPGGQYAGY
ncbi:hypothetical protein BJ742DRAFT_819726 [Cladochytrium replicatum]|nr:hypothetical protein BJ742DRAFT_819726 [Cladochytrium replicatum]